MTNWMTQSTIARFHQARHAKMAPPAATEEPPPMKAHPHPTTFHSFVHESHIYRLHEDRHHGVIHATSPSTSSAVAGVLPSWTDFCTKSTIQRRHVARHALIGVSN